MHISPNHGLLYFVAKSIINAVATGYMKIVILASSEQIGTGSARRESFWKTRKIPREGLDSQDKPE